MDFDERNRKAMKDVQTRPEAQCSNIGLVKLTKSVKDSKDYLKMVFSVKTNNVNVPF